MAPKVARLQQRPAKHAGVNIDLRITKHSQQQKRAYLVTITHPCAWTPQGRLAKKTSMSQNGGAPLASPSEFDRAGIEQVFLRASQQLVYEGLITLWWYS